MTEGKGGMRSDRLAAKAKDSRLLIVAILVAISASVIYSYLSITRYLSMDATAYDLGLYSQIFASAVHGGFFDTRLLGESFLSEHFSPIVFLIVGPYYLYQSAVTLLIIQSLMIAGASLPLYMLAREFYSRTISMGASENRVVKFIPLVISVSFLLTPMAVAPISFDFHLMTFLPMFYFASTYFFLRKRWVLSGIFMALIVSIHSSFVFIVIFQLISDFFLYRYLEAKSGKDVFPIFSRKAMGYFAIFLGMVAVLAAYYYGIAYVKPIFSGFPPNVSGPYSGQSGSVSDSIGGLAMSLLTNPSAVIAVLVAGSHIKLFFLFMGFMSTGFISIFFPEALLGTIPYLVYGMFSSYQPYYTVGYQYSMMLIPMVYIATVASVARVIRKSGHINVRSSNSARKYIAPLIILLMVSTSIWGAFMTPYSPPSVFHNPGSVSDLWEHRPDNASIFAANISKEVPQQSFILTQNDVFPFFSSSVNSYSTPWSPGISNENLSRFTFIVAYYGSQWVYTSSGSTPSLYNLVIHALSTGNYGIYSEGYGVLALKENYTSGPVNYIPSKLSIPGMNLSVAAINSHFPQNGVASNVYNGSGFFSSNTNLLLPGTYKATIHYNTSRDNSSNSFILNASSKYSHTDFGSINVSLSRSSLQNGTYSQTLTFTTKSVYNDLVFSASRLYWNGTISIKSISVVQTSP